MVQAIQAVRDAENFFLFPSPRILPACGKAQHFSVSGAVVMAMIVTLITYPRDLKSNPFWESDNGQLLLESRRYICAEFIRRYFDKGFKDWVMPRKWERSVKDQIRLEATLWGETWKLIEQLYSRSVIVPDQHPAFTLYSIIVEEALLQPYSLSLSPEALDALTATSAMRDIQIQNKLLQALGTECKGKIPFDRKKEPVTWELIELSRHLAGRSEDFQKQFIAVVRARMALTAHLRSVRPKVYSDDRKRKVEHRGRKPKA